jgi:hypothetical protein
VTFVLISSVIKMLLYFLALYPHFAAFSQAQLLEATDWAENSAEPRAVGSVSSTIQVLHLKPARNVPWMQSKWWLLGMNAVVCGNVVETSRAVC